MVILRPDTYGYQLFELLAVIGEFPTRSLSILGNERSVKDMVYKLSHTQCVRFSKDGDLYHGALFSVSGKRQYRTIRLHINALKMLCELNPDALAHYMETTYEHCFSGDRQHITRNHRIAEAVAIMMKAGIECRPYMLPELNLDYGKAETIRSNRFYMSRYIKSLETLELNKSIYTRMLGALFTPSRNFAVYNTRDAVMKWDSFGESKVLTLLQGISRANTLTQKLDDALLFGKDAGIAAKLLEMHKDGMKKDMSFTRIYNRIHFMPLNEDGIRLLKLLLLPDFKIRACRFLFPDDTQIHSASAICDGVFNGALIFSHLDGDVARLMRFKIATKSMPEEKFVMVCFPWQHELIEAYLPGIEIQEVDMTEFELAMQEG